MGAAAVLSAPAGAPASGAGALVGVAAAAGSAGLGRKGGLHRVGSGERERDALLSAGDGAETPAGGVVHVRFDGGSADR